jgi:hypothetical protein
MKRIKPGIPYLITGVVLLAVGVGAAAAWRNFLPLVIGAAFLAIGVVAMVRQKRTGGSK